MNLKNELREEICGHIDLSDIISSFNDKSSWKNDYSVEYN